MFNFKNTYLTIVLATVLVLSSICSVKAQEQQAGIGYISDTKQYKNLQQAENATDAREAERQKAAAGLQAAQAELAKQTEADRKAKAEAEAVLKNPNATSEQKKAAQAQYTQAASNIESAEKSYNIQSLQQEYNRADKDYQKAIGQQGKAQEKAGKKAQKEANKDLRSAEKELRQAERDLKKAEKSGDPEAIANARARKAAAEANVMSASARANDFDGSKAAAASQAEYDRQARESEANLSRDRIEWTKAKQAACRDPEIQGDPFAVITCKVMLLLSDVRSLVYVIAGFGLVFFAFAAIFGKMNWKHLAQIGFSLFLLAMMAPFIAEFVSSKPDEYKLSFGDFLPYDKDAIIGSNGLSKEGANGPGIVDASKEKYSWRDLKGSIQSGIQMAKTGYDMYNSTRVAVETVKENAAYMKEAMKNHEGGLSGFLTTAGAISSAGENIMFAGGATAHMINNNTAGVANNFQDMLSTNNQRQQNRIDRASGMSTNSMAGFMTDENRAGARITNTTTNIATTGMQAAHGVGRASSEALAGARIGGGLGTTGGDIVGSIFGAASLIGEGTGLADQKIPRQKPQNQNQYGGVTTKPQTYNAPGNTNTQQSNASVQNGVLTVHTEDGGTLTGYSNGDGTYQNQMPGGTTVNLNENGEFRYENNYPTGGLGNMNLDPKFGNDGNGGMSFGNNQSGGQGFNPPQQNQHGNNVQNGTFYQSDNPNNSLSNFIVNTQNNSNNTAVLSSDGSTISITSNDGNSTMSGTLYGDSGMYVLTSPTGDSIFVDSKGNYISDFNTNAPPSSSAGSNNQPPNTTINTSGTGSTGGLPKHKEIMFDGVKRTAFQQPDGTWKIQGSDKTGYQMPNGTISWR